MSSSLSPLTSRSGFSLEGVVASIFLLDQTCFHVRISPTTTARAVVRAIADVMGLQHDAHHSLFFLHSLGEFIEIEDEHLVATCVGNGTSWADACEYFFVFRSLALPSAWSDSQSPARLLLPTASNHQSYYLLKLTSLFLPAPSPLLSFPLPSPQTPFL